MEREAPLYSASKEGKLFRNSIKRSRTLGAIGVIFIRTDLALFMSVYLIQAETPGTRAAEIKFQWFTEQFQRKRKFFNEERGIIGIDVRKGDCRGYTRLWISEERFTSDGVD